MDYYHDYCIDSLENLESKLCSNYVIKQDVRILGEFSSLGKVVKINGHLNIDNDHLTDLGELVHVKTDLWLNNNSSKLKSLCKLESIGGNLSLRYSNVSDLGNLQRVIGNVNLRDTLISNLGNLKYVGGNLYLPKRLEGISLENIDIKGKVRFWNDVKDTKIEALKQTIDWKFDEYFSDFHVKELEHQKKHLTGEYLVKRCYTLSQYNRYTIENIHDFIDFVDYYLNGWYGDKFSFYHVLFDELKSIHQINNEFPTFKVDKRQDRSVQIEKLKSLTDNFLNENINKPFIIKYIRLIDNFKSNPNWNGNNSKIWLRCDEHELGYSEYAGKFEWDPFKGRNIFNDCFIYFVENKLLEIFSILIDTLQNDFRISRGLPRIGEGWIGETNLFYQLKEKLPGQEIIQHGRPSWLGRQHLDIWMPELNIAIEYHGLQHDQPVDFFGGHQAYEKNIERDNRKKELCKENGVKLIEVREGYDLDSLLTEIIGSL
jgi:hypothetical protein